MEENANYEITHTNHEEFIYGEKYNMFYSNSLDVQTSITEFMIDFKITTPKGVLDNQKILLNPSLAKQLRNVLNLAVEQYEEVHGEVKDIESLQVEASNFYETE